MARITVEDSLEVIPNQYALIRITTNRAKQLLGGSQPLIAETKNRSIVTALREIAAGKVVTILPKPEDTDGEE